MRSSWKYSLPLILLIVGLNLFLWIFARTVLLPNFIEHEEIEMHDHISRVLYEIEDELKNLAILAYDWGAWDDTYGYMKANGQVQEYAESNLGDMTWVDLELSMVAFIAPDGDVVFAKSIEPDIEQVTALSAEQMAFIQSSSVLWQDAGVGKSRRGLTSVAGVPILLIVQPILQNGGEGPAVGSLIFARSFDGDEIEALGERTQLFLNLIPYASQDVATNHVVSLGDGFESFGYTGNDNDADKFFGQIRLNDIFDQPSMFLQVGMSRHVYWQWVHTVHYFLAWSAVMSSFAGIIVWLIMRKLATSADSVRKSENEYKALSLEFQTILNGMKSSVTLIGPDMRVVWANRAAVGMMELDEWDSGASRMSDLINVPGVHGENSLVLRSMQDGHFLEEVQDGDGGRKTSIKVFPLLDDANKVTGVIKLEADITEEFLLREEVHRAGRLAALGELSAGIAHEVNNPNGMILRNLGLISDVFNAAWPILDREAEKNPDMTMGGLRYTRIREDLPTLLKDMKGGSLRIKTIVEDLKEFARSEDFVDYTDDIDLNALAQTCHRLTAGPVQQKTHNFKTTLAADLPKVKGAIRQLEQVVINLIMNASQALTSSSQKVEIRTHVDRDNSTLVLAVEDEGSGILPDDLGKIMNPFYTTKRNDGGTGLGLSVSARIVEKHGGSLRFKSSVDTGTTAYLSLPMNGKD